LRRAARKDENHDQIAEAFRALGWQVIEAYQFAQFCPGFPDIIAIKDGVVRFVEVKTPVGRLTKTEKAFLDRFPQIVRVVRSVDDVLEMR